MSRFIPNAENILYLIIGLLLLFLVAKEAAGIPITHDEVSTIVFSQQSVYDIVTYTDPIPNNHILNTLFLKASIAIFGDKPFTDRLPNVLFFIPYFVFAVLIVKLLFSESWVRISVVLMLTLQPFLLDFFSLTRGYGMSVSLQMAAIYYFFKRVQTRQNKPLILAAGMGALSVVASFTLLNFFLPLVALLSVDAFMGRSDKDRKFPVKEMIALISITGILFFICYLPFVRMVSTNQFSFWGSSGFFTDTVKPLIIGIRSGTEYFRWSNDVVYNILLSLVCFMFVIDIVFARHLQNKKYFYFSAALLFLTVVYNLAQFYIMHVPFLNARGSLLFIPLVVLNIGFAIQALYERKKMAGLILALFLGILSVQHFIRGYSVKGTYEWYYDVDTYNVLKDLDYIIQTENIPKPVKLNCHWIFYPSLSYHIKQKYQDVIQLVPYHKDIQPESDTNFYYTQSEEVDQLSAKFMTVREYTWRSRFLLKVK